MKLLFIQDAIYNGKVKYKKDQVVDIDNKLGEADRWIKRAVAVEPSDVKPEESNSNPPNKNKNKGKDKNKDIKEDNTELDQPDDSLKQSDDSSDNALKLL